MLVLALLSMTDSGSLVTPIHGLAKVHFDPLVDVTGSPWPGQKQATHIGLMSHLDHNVY